jgi:ATP-dependent Clp protease ATP-binding subunit ClpB
MNIDIYSDRAKQAIQSAQSLAMARRHQQLAPEHILKVLLACSRRRTACPPR